MGNFEGKSDVCYITVDQVGNEVPTLLFPVKEACNICGSLLS